MIWNFIKAHLSKGNSVLLMVVVKSSGSSPGRAGFKMAISENGEMHGSIGGGEMEYNLTEFAKECMVKDCGIILKQQKHKATSDNESSGMICSGSQAVALYPMNEDSLDLINSIINTSEGFIEFTESGIKLAELSAFKKNKREDSLADENNWNYRESLELIDRLYIFGGGHVSLALCKAMRELDFHITVFDNRDEKLPTFRNNSYVDEKLIIDYTNISKHLKKGYNNYVVIMTYGHKTDEVILKEIISSETKYIGLMGSKAKVARIFKNLEEGGISRHLLDKVSAPIGIPIHSETPAEIAISVAAQIIKTKNRSN